MSLHISHTALEGTTIEGTTRGDGTNTILKACGWRWSSQIAKWYVPQSRDQAPKLRIIDATVESLAAAGFDVEVSVDWTARATADVENDRHQRAVDRATRLEAGAATAAAASSSAEAIARKISDAIPFGQPILVGHHSERRHRNDLAKIGRATKTSIEAQQRADELERAAAIAIANDAGRAQPQAVARRISALEAQQRKTDRALAGYTNHLGDTFPPATGEYRVRLKAQLAALLEQLEYWNSVRTKQIDKGAAPVLGPETVAKGDQVLYMRTWYPVVRANAKSVSVRSLAGGSWTDTIPYHQLEGHRPAAS